MQVIRLVDRNGERSCRDKQCQLKDVWLIESSRTLVDLREHDDTRELCLGVVCNCWVKDEDPCGIVSFSRKGGASNLLRTHVTTRLGGYILVCFRDEHCAYQLLVVVFVNTVKLAVRGMWGGGATTPRRFMYPQASQRQEDRVNYTSSFFLSLTPHKGILLS